MIGAPVSIEPLGPWTTADDGVPRRSTMSTSLAASLLDLGAEAARIDADAVTVELDVDAGSIRADARALRKDRPGPRTGRVRVTLHMPDAAPALVYATSNLTGHDAAPHELALRSIVKSLEALRSLGRWGVLKGQQYTGSRALPPGTAMSGGDGVTRDRAWAARELAEMTGLPADTPFGDLLRAARYHASDAVGRERLAKVRAVVSGQEATEEREAFERWRREQDDEQRAIEGGVSSDG